VELRSLYREPDQHDDLSFGALELHDVFKIFHSGPVETVADALAGYAAVGIRHPILIFRSPWDLETIRSLGAIKEAVAARVGRF